MSGWADMLLLIVVLIDLWIVSTSRLASCVWGAAMQGVALGLLPVALWLKAPGVELVHLLLISGGTLLLKAVAIPHMLFRAIRQANVRREVEPFVSLHLSVLIGALLVGISFWIASGLVLPRPAPTTLLVPAAFATLLNGLLLLVSRKKAVTQVVGYLMLENGVFIFGQILVSAVPFVVELGILLDVLVGVFVMGIAIHHISREFDHIDTGLLSSLKDY